MGNRRSKVTMRSTAFVLAACVPAAFAYSLVDDYMENNYADFFDKFSFWTAEDTTKGFVQYVSEADAWSKGLIGNGGNIYMGVDTKTNNPSAGRASTRLTSTKAYNINTLFVADIAHMPGGTCGTWPAFWTTASTSTWPQQGEIDIIEEANNADTNQVSIHVSSKQGSCSVSSSAAMSATKDRWGDCTQESTGGCDAQDPRHTSYGAGFNNAEGGVYAMEWTAAHIRVYFFPRSAIPSGDNGPLGKSPDPSKWGTPTTSFEGCDFNAHVKQQRIVINTDFCGTWAAGTWGSSGCAASTGVGDCETYVRDNGAAFKEAFWTFKGLKVLQ